MFDLDGREEVLWVMVTQNIFCDTCTCSTERPFSLSLSLLGGLLGTGRLNVGLNES